MTVKPVGYSIDQHVGSRVHMRRLMLGVSEQELANALAATCPEIQEYDKGVARIGAGRLQQLARLLQVAPTFFFERINLRGR